jgi:phage tail sheath gpL-like
MAKSNIPTDKRRPGTFFTFDDVSGARGLTPITRSLCVIGMKASTGTWTVNQPIQVFNEAEADLGGAGGSEIALMCRAALKTFRKRGAAAQLFACPIAEPAGTAATRTFTVAGTATAAGDLIVLIAGRTLRVPVKLADSANTIAASIKSAIDILAATGDLPGTGSVATNVATFTYRHLGANGADLKVAVVSSVPGVTVTAATGVAGSGVASITPALDALGSRDYLAIAIANHAAQDVTDLGAHADAMWAAARKRYRHLFLAETGTLGTSTTLASPANRKELLVLGLEGGRNLPCEIAATVAAMTQTKERPSYNWDGTELPLYPPVTPDLVFDDAEVETAILGGVTPLTVADSGAVRIERLVTTKATQAGAAFESLRDYASSATAAYYARQVDAKFARALEGANLDGELLRDLKGLAYATLKDGERIGDLHHVDDHAAELVVVAHDQVPSRALTEIPVSVVPNAHQVDATIRFFSEAAAA